MTEDVNFFDEIDECDIAISQETWTGWPDNVHPYNEEIEWGGADDISILAMWMGDPAAEMYCWDKSNRLGGYPWDENVRVHPSYGQPQKRAELQDHDVLNIMYAVGVLVAAMILCSVLIT